MESPNKGHFGTSHVALVLIVLCREVVLFSEVQTVLVPWEWYFEELVSFTERLSLSQRVLYRRFHCSDQLTGHSFRIIDFNDGQHAFLIMFVFMHAKAVV